MEKWIKDVRVNPTPNENIAELQDITAARLEASFNYERHVTQKQARAAHKYHGLWTHARSSLQFEYTADRQKIPFKLKDLEHFSRSARRDEAITFACGMLLQYMAERDLRWLWREARASMLRPGDRKRYAGKKIYADHVDNAVLYGMTPAMGNVDSWVKDLRFGLNRLVAFFDAKRKVDYETADRLLLPFNAMVNLDVADANQRIAAADAGRIHTDVEAFGNREEESCVVNARAA